MTVTNASSDSESRLSDTLCRYSLSADSSLVQLILDQLCYHWGQNTIDKVLNDLLKLFQEDPILAGSYGLTNVHVLKNALSERQPPAEIRSEYKSTSIPQRSECVHTL